MTCAWCQGPLPDRAPRRNASARQDRRFCSKKCRQNHWKFARHIREAERAASPLALGYADPPYPGKEHYYRDHPDYRPEPVDLGALLEELQLYDGWALSTSSDGLPTVLYEAKRRGIHPRVASWHRGARHVPSGHPLDGWEPVVYVPARELALDSGRVNVLEYHAQPLRSDPNRVIGAKPAAFCAWLFELLGALPGDDFRDLFPGSGAVARAWDLYMSRAEDSSQLRLLP
jgi:hypothetical protein